jgi:hypothetical protein
MAKIAKLILSYPHQLLDAHRGQDVYKVVRAQHTTEFNPGDYLTKVQVDELNLSRQWDVSTVSSKV